MIAVQVQTLVRLIIVKLPLEVLHVNSIEVFRSEKLLFLLYRFLDVPAADNSDIYSFLPPIVVIVTCEYKL